MTRPTGDPDWLDLLKRDGGIDNQCIEQVCACSRVRFSNHSGLRLRVRVPVASDARLLAGEIHSAAANVSGR